MAQRLVNFCRLSCCAAESTDDVSRSDNLKANFKKPGKNGMNVFRGVMITGPPGIGKTSSAHLCANLAGFTPIELNASDARSKKLVEVCHLVSPLGALTPKL
jgi:DNA polymerase III delta prime subunit